MISIITEKYYWLTPSEFIIEVIWQNLWIHYRKHMSITEIEEYIEDYLTLCECSEKYPLFNDLFYVRKKANKKSNN